MKHNTSVYSCKTTIVLLIIPLFLLFHSSASAQRNWKNYLLTGSSMLVSGMLDGSIESISYHYDNGFKRRLPKANNQFWDPSLSWKNKYKNGNCELGPKFVGSTNVLAWTTDGYHMLRTAKRTVDGLTLAYYVNKECSETITKKKRWKNMATDFLVTTVIRCIGFNLTYSVIFNTHQHYSPFGR